MSRMPSTFKVRSRIATAVGLSCALLAACGGGGDSSSTDNTTPVVPVVPVVPTTTALTGKVIDGYVNGATLCLDLNANQACDTGEPTATSGVGGAYSLNTTGLDAAAVARAYVLVTVPATAKDEDDGGQTLEQAGKLAFTLLAPVATDAAGAATATVVTPLTTLVSQQMIVAGLSANDAVASVRSQFGLGGSGSLNIDYKADASAAALAGVAKVAAVALGEVQAAVARGAGSASSREQLIASLSAVSQTLGSVQAALGLDANPSAPVSLANIQAALSASTTALAADASAAIAAARGTVAGTAASLEAILAQGMYDVNEFNTSCSGSSCTAEVSIHVTSGAGGTWTDTKWRSVNNGPYARSTDTSDDWTLGASGWEAQSTGGTYTTVADGSFRVTGSNFGSVGAVGRFRIQDLAGQTLRSVGFGDVSATATFPAGAQANWGSFFLANDSYRLRSDEQVRIFGSSTTSTPSSLAAMVAAWQTSADGSTRRGNGGWNGLQYSFDGALASSGSLSFWGSTGLLGKGSYELRTVSGQQVLIVTQAPLAALAEAALNNTYILGEYGNRTRPIYAVKDGAVYQGSFTTAGTVVETVPGLNLAAANAVLQARGRCRLVSGATGGSVCP